jgi:hypothetical protein
MRPFDRLRLLAAPLAYFLAAGQFGCGRQLVCDAAFRDLTESGIFGGKFFERFNERAMSAAKLLHALGDNVYEDVGIRDDRGRVAEVVVSHRCIEGYPSDVLGPDWHFRNATR